MTPWVENLVFKSQIKVYVAFIKSFAKPQNCIKNKTKLNKLRSKSCGNIVIVFKSKILQPLYYKTHNDNNKIMPMEKFQRFIFAMAFH